MKMPTPDLSVLASRDELIHELGQFLGSEQIVIERSALRAYESDGLTAYQQLPLLVVLPENTTQVSKILKLCSKMKVNVVPRGAGTSLSGGALPLEDGIVLSMGKFNRILDVDFSNRCVVAQSGVTNLDITNAVKDKGFYYAPDPSSQIVCSIGGNVNENSGGVHCLKYGLTSNNLLGLEVVLMNGEIIRLGGKYMDAEGYDLLGVLTGSEGLLCVVTEVTVRILQSPESVRALLLGFPDNEKAGQCVAEIIAAGIIPAGIEMMDELAIKAAEDFCHAGYPLDCAALLIVELDGPAAEVEELIETVRAIANNCHSQSIRVSENDEERIRIWAGRKAAFPALGTISPDYYCMDGTIPRKQLSYVLTKMTEMSRQYGLRVANVFHAGDGNLHPLILFDANIDEEMEKAEQFGADILKLCVEVGGVLSGEHGIGVEKRDLMPEYFSEQDLQQQQRVKCAFDPESRLNPGKMFPVLHRCAELGRLHVHKGKLPFPDIPRF
ncbi:MAG: FAD-binding protein [Gammaproteobacteria bacterium]|nr:FAD-binding protein [Gammaproteobacteria bacterium]